MLLHRQFVDEDLGCASYLICDPEAGSAVVVDPAFRIEQYLEAAEAEGVRIERVLETHTHADHVSGHGRFALEHGGPGAIHPLGEPAFPFEPLADGQIVPVGSVAVRVVHTPGHRPEHCSFVVDAQLVLTGDSLFVGAAARPDERAAIEQAIECHPGITKVHELLTLVLGPQALLVAARVDLRDDLAGDEVERLSNEIDEDIRKAVPDVTEVFLDATP